MLKQRTTQVSIALGAGLSALLLGAALSTFTGSFVWRWPRLGTVPNSSSLVAPDSHSNSKVAALAAVSPEQRASQLQEIAEGPQSLDRNRARYLLASDLIRQKQGEQAIAWLENLETDYPALAPYVLIKRAQAYEISGNSSQAKAIWAELLQRYPNDSASVEALFVLGRENAQYWDKAIAQFPKHPRTHEIIGLRLRKNPNQFELLLAIARHAVNAQGITAVLDRLVSNRAFAAQLQPTDWEAIAFNYWEHQEYGKASEAYARATQTPLNAYRVGRGLQLSGQDTEAYAAYQQFVRNFPNDAETAMALIRMARLTPKPLDGIAYLDQVVSRFPDHAAEALLLKADILEQLSSGKSASQVRQAVLTQYPASTAAAQLRWNQAQKQAAAGNLLEAWQWAEPITKYNPDSEFAPEAAFWVGKWASQLGQQQDAKSAFEFVLTQYPESYYAWRSAVMLGWNVGDFTTVRQMSPEVSWSGQRMPLPVGSETLQELYQLGQNQDAWSRWQVEFQNPVQPSVAEQFTDGVIRLGVGDNLDGIFMISSLSWREKPEERSQYQALKQQPVYWQSLYPFPFSEAIATWSQQHELNPLLVTALIRQESRFEPKIRSVVGATGLMQVMPETAAWVAEKIKFKGYKLDNPDDNIKLGTWYLGYTHEEYDNNSLFAVASYNAGPGTVADWIAKKKLSDPDAFVETIPYAETQGYVKSVFENYWNYLRLYNPEIAQQLAQYTSTRQTAFKR